MVLRGNASDGFEHVASLGEATLFTVHAHDGAVAMVGGASSGVIYETEGDALVERTPEGTPLLQGVCVADDGVVWTAGFGGSVYARRGVAFEPVDTGLDFSAAESLHAIWVDPEGGVWAAGGDVLTPELDQGLAIHRGAPVPPTHVEPSD
jgi:streptogramin lyase